MPVQSIVYPVTDLAAAKAFYADVFGVEPHTDTPYYVGYHVDGVELALDPNGAAKGLTGATPFWPVPDVEAAATGLVAAGASTVQEPGDVGGGTVTAVLKDADGNLVGLIQQ